MNTNFETATNSDVVQPTVGFEPTVQPLNTCAPTIDRFPFFSLNSETSSLLAGCKKYVFDWEVHILADTTYELPISVLVARGSC